MQIDVPFMLERATLTSLLYCEKKLVLTPELKGDATIEIYLNGVL